MKLIRKSNFLSEKSWLEWSSVKQAVDECWECRQKVFEYTVIFIEKK